MSASAYICTVACSVWSVVNVRHRRMRCRASLWMCTSLNSLAQTGKCLAYGIYRDDVESFNDVQPSCELYVLCQRFRKWYEQNMIQSVSATRSSKTSQILIMWNGISNRNVAHVTENMHAPLSLQQLTNHMMCQQFFVRLTISTYWRTPWVFDVTNAHAPE